MEISDNTGWIIMPKSQQSALNLRPDIHALSSISPHQIPKSRQSVALSLGPLLIHLASPHYWTGRCEIPWTLPPSWNQMWPFTGMSHFYTRHNRSTAVWWSPLKASRCEVISMWSYASTRIHYVQEERKKAVSFSVEHVFIQQQLEYQFKYQQCRVEMQNERTYLLWGDALTASRMWVEYVRFMKRCVLLDGAIHIQIATRGKGMHCIATT